MQPPRTGSLHTTRGILAGLASLAGVRCWPSTAALVENATSELLPRRWDVRVQVKESSAPPGQWAAERRGCGGKDLVTLRLSDWTGPHLGMD